DAQRVVIVTSPMPGDGKTTVAVNLAGTIARQGKKVVLIDADLRRGVVHSVFQLPRSPGLSDVLTSVIDVGGAIRVLELAPGRVLHILTRGTPNADPAHVLGPVESLVTQMASEFDWVIIDSPPINVVADAALLGATGSGVLLA